MAGKRETQEKTNHTLVTIANILNEEKINDWFIFYGTLLGIIRENNCIEDDDDIDIIINYDYDELRKIFKKHGFKFTTKFGIGKSKKILKTVSTDEFASFDFYICDVDETGLFNVSWCKNKISNCYVDLNKKTFIEKKWKSTILHLPNDYENKLVSMYGDWKTPGPGKVPYGFDI